MAEMMGIIDDTVKESFLEKLTFHRSIASVPFGGNYRFIDFILSSMTNSDIKNIGVLLQNKDRSLIDHLGSGRNWNLNRKKDGLFLLSNNYARQNHFKKKRLNYLYNNLDYIKKSSQEFVAFADSRIIASFNFKDVLLYHQSRKADITLICSRNSSICNKNDNIYPVTDENGRVVNLLVRPGNTCFTHCFILKRRLLVKIINALIKEEITDVYYNVIKNKLGKYKVYAYYEDKYITMIKSVQDYYQSNMDLLKQNVRKELFTQNKRVYTNIDNIPPTKYISGNKVKNSLIANGCIIEGKVENSILFNNVKIHKNAYVKNSIIMKNSEVKSNAVIEKVILDKNVIITPGKKLLCKINKPMLVKKKEVI